MVTMFKFCRRIARFIEIRGSRMVFGFGTSVQGSVGAFQKNMLSFEAFVDDQFYGRTSRFIFCVATSIEASTSHQLFIYLKNSLSVKIPD